MHPERSCASVDISKQSTSWRGILAFFGPAYLVSVGYMDPGNWATDLAGGSQFGYSLHLGAAHEQPDGAAAAKPLRTVLALCADATCAQANRETYPKKSILFYTCWRKWRLPLPTWPKCWAWPSRYSPAHRPAADLGRGHHRIGYLPVAFPPAIGASEKWRPLSLGW